MKTKMILTHRFFSILFIACLLTACSTDGNDGTVGAQGAQGEQGPAGPQGEDGTDGVDGETGTANVIYSPRIQFDWDTPIESSAEFNVDAPDFTQEIFDTGVLLVYARGFGGAMYALPVTLDRPAGFEGYAVNFVGPGSFVIRVESLDGNDIGSPILGDEFRYVIIPGGISTSGKSSSMDYAKMSYEEIAALFNIQD